MTTFLLLVCLVLSALPVGAQSTPGIRYIIVSGEVPPNRTRDLQDCKEKTGGVEPSFFQCMLAKGYSAERDVKGQWGAAGGQEWPAPIVPGARP